MGLLAGENDYELMERTQYDRNISRHNYTVEEIETLVEKPVVKKLCRLMQFRNEYPVFDGEMSLPDTDDSCLSIVWSCKGLEARLDARLKEKSFTITYLDRMGEAVTLSLEEDFKWDE